MNINIWKVLFLAILQGVTELFPISSLGHTVIFPALLGWGDLVRDERFLPLITALHLGTSIALVIYFWRDWLNVILTLVNSVKQGEIKKGTDSWISWLVIIGCIPAGIIGVFLENPLKKLFASPIIAAVFLAINGLILLLGEWMRRRAVSRQTEQGGRPLNSLTWKEAIVVGLAQSLALIPGISRSGTTMVAALGIRLSHEDAARFSFLLGTPIIAAAALLEVPQLFSLSASILGLVLLGMVVSGIAAFFSTRFLLKYFEHGRLNPFAYYCIIVGLASLVFFVVFHS